MCEKINHSIDRRFILVFLLPFLPVTPGCSTAPTHPPEEASTLAENLEIHKLLSDLSSHIQTLEVKLSSMNDKFEATQISLNHFINEQKTKPSPVLASPSAHSGLPIDPSLTDTDSEPSFVNDSAVRVFREAMLLFKGQQYSEANLAFSGFLDKFPDHVLAGSAQFYIGECYFREKEFRLAIKEFQRILSSYDRSPHISDALLKISLAEESIKNAPEAAKHRQLLSSLFPQSPAMASENTANPPSTSSTRTTLDNPPAASAESEAESTSKSPSTENSSNSFARPGLDQPPTAPLTSNAQP